MPLDPYSLCPGGREKKIRFCCPDMVKEIEQIERLLESEQAGSCLSFIETLEKNHPDCACLYAAKLSVYRTENRWEDALTLSRQFIAKEPENPVAASELALALAMNGSLKESIHALIDAFERAKEGTAHSSLINAALQVGAVLLMQGQILPVVALGNRLKMFPSAQESANALLYKASSLAEIPLLLRDMMFENHCPDGFPAVEEFDDAIELLALMCWKKGLAKLESLTKYADAWPMIWRNVAAVRFWLMDEEQGCEALKTFASLPNTSQEDAVDAEATRLFMTKDSLGDQTEILFVEFPVADSEKVHEKLLSTPNFYFIDVDPRAYVYQNVPPPRCAFVLLDRPFAKPDAGEPTLDTVSSQLATCVLFGKETNRSARLEIMELLTDDRAKVETMLREAVGDWLQEPEKVETGRTLSKTQALIQYRFRFTPDSPISPEIVKRLEKEYYERTFAEAWCNLPLGYLDGKTPAGASADKSYAIRILAAIQTLEYWMNEETGIDVANMLRQRLGLPALDSIPIPAGTEEELLGMLDNHPVWRWYRLDVEKLPTIALLEGIQIVAVMKEPRAASRFAREILNRSLGEFSPEMLPARLLAFESLIGIAMGTNDLDEALLWVERAKNEAEELKISDAGWLLHEITIRLGSGQVDKAQEIIGLFVKKHGNDPKAMQGLQNLFVQMGFLNPDGTPSAAMQRNMERQPAAKEPASGLWTPDAPSGGPAQGTSKLWTPD